MKKHLGLIPVGFLLGMLVYGFVNFDQALNLSQYLLSGLLGVFVVYVVFYSNPLLNTFLDWKKHTGLRLLLGILANTLGGFLIIGLGVLAYKTVQGNIAGAAILDMEEGIKIMILLFCAAIIYNVAYFFFYSYNQYSTAQLTELKTNRQQAELQLATLKAQLSPHFLFNCINSLSVLIHDNANKAESFIRAMAKLYQYTLENCRESLISVRSELEFVNSYAFLLQTRFGEAFTLKVDLDERHLDSLIPPLTLQLLVENAVKHNTVNQANPMLVTLNGDAGSLTVSNTKNPISRAKASTGVGLNNIKGRYDILSKRSEIRIDNSEKFAVTLPLLTDE